MRKSKDRSLHDLNCHCSFVLLTRAHALNFTYFCFSHQARILGMVEMNRSSKILKRVNSAVESNHAAGVAAEIGSMFKDNKIQQQQQKSRQLPQLPFVVLATQKASGGNTHSSSEVTANTSYPAIPSTPRLYDILKKKNKKKQALKLEEVPREPSTRELLNRLINRTAMGHYIPPKGEQPLSSLGMMTNT